MEQVLFSAGEMLERKRQAMQSLRLDVMSGEEDEEGRTSL